MNVNILCDDLRPHDVVPVKIDAGYFVVAHSNEVLVKRSDEWTTIAIEKTFNTQSNFLDHVTNQSFIFPHNWVFSYNKAYKH